LQLLQPLNFEGQYSLDGAGAFADLAHFQTERHYHKQEKEDPEAGRSTQSPLDNGTTGQQANEIRATIQSS